MARAIRKRSAGARVVDGSACMTTTPSFPAAITIPSFAVFVFLLLSTTPFLLVSSETFPLQYEVRRKQTHCLYSKLDGFKDVKNNHATFSVFVLESSHGNLAATVTVEGPLIFDEEKRSKEDLIRIKRAKSSGMHTDTSSTGYQLLEATRQFNQDGANRKDSIDQKFLIDFTHAGEEEDARPSNVDEYRENAQPIEDMLVHPDSVAPYEFTKRIMHAGWYRLCLSADYSRLIVEMDIRSSVNLGGIDSKTGHVYSYNKREELDEEALIDGEEIDWAGRENVSAATKEEEALQRKSRRSVLQKEVTEGVTDYDIEKTRSLMKKLNQHVAEISSSQHGSHRRFKEKEGRAKRTYDRIVFDSAMETLFYVLITGFQVYTIHKWLCTGNLLGK